MKIFFAVPGHLKTVPMGKFCLDALRALGHEVNVFDFHPGFLDRLKNRLGSVSSEEQASVNKRLRKAIDQAKPDIFITLFGFDVSVESLDYLRKKTIPSACWWINDPFQFQRSLKKAPHYDYIFSNSVGSTERYRMAGIANAFFLPTACDSDVHHPVPPQDKYRCDVCFAGDWSPVREQILGALAERFEIKIFGPWKKKLRADSQLHKHLIDGFFTPMEMAAMFSSAKVVLNIHTWFETHDHGVNPRLFEAAACGACQVVDWKQEIPVLFDCEAELRCYRNQEELFCILEELLANDMQRQSLSQAAQAKARSEHTYSHRMEQLLTVIAANPIEHQV